MQLIDTDRFNLTGSGIRPRTVDTLYQAYAEGLKCISKGNAQSFVNHSMKFAT